MGITGLLPFIDKASRRTNISEFSGCTVAIDSYCWLHKGTYSCADKLIRGEQTDMHIRYCMKYVTMLLSHNIKPILVFDGRHLPAKAMTESKRRESRDISKKRAAELLSLGQECRKRNVDCIVAPYEADAQLAYLNIKNIAHIVITEDSDLILFGCTKVFFKMDPEGVGTLVDTTKLPLAMKCSIERYSFEKFRQMCIMSGCDYLASLPGIGLAKARQFVIATQDPNFANALKKLPSFLKKSSLVVSDEYRESFMKAEATFKHQYVYDPLERKMVRLTEPDDEEIEQAFCVNAGELLDPKTAFELALGNLDPFTLKKMDDWHPDYSINKNAPVKTNNWKEKGVSSHPSIWSKDFLSYLDESHPWRKKEKKPDLSIETLSNMYCMEPAAKKQKIDCDNELSETFTQCTEDQHNRPINEDDSPDQFSTRDNKSPILENKERSFKKLLKTGQHSVLKKLSRFPRTVLDNNVVESKFFSSNEEGSTNEVDVSKESITIEESPEHSNRNPFKKRAKMSDEDSQKENFECNSSPVRPSSPILEPSPKCRRNIITDIVMEEHVVDNMASEDSVIDNTYPMETLITPTASQTCFEKVMTNKIVIIYMNSVDVILLF
ncbi:unnamed protein product [Spodoptera littoralis]|uniref:Exonuclease 1 n=1 Tax=Spodoptera littoralis TaxID=7109 RepID=A0A9P0I2J1_SPOLI|nr:unnamed protein product [Spodoptera littoralis]CAH1638849.1 unnamed protein product [Spodoptera littoralis]